MPLRNKSRNVISIKNEQEKIRLSVRVRQLIKDAVNAALDFEDYRARTEVSVVITDDGGIRRLNAQFRQKDVPTDVLSFPMDDDELLGDIVISLEKARSQAEEYGHSIEREVAFLCVHSVLHLLGYDHEASEEQERLMFAKQELILTKMGLAR